MSRYRTHYYLWPASRMYMLILGIYTANEITYSKATQKHKAIGLIQLEVIPSFISSAR